MVENSTTKLSVEIPSGDMDIFKAVKYDCLDKNLWINVLLTFNINHPIDKSPYELADDQIATIREELQNKISATNNSDPNCELDNILFCFGKKGNFVCTHNKLSERKRNIILPKFVMAQLVKMEQVSFSFFDRIKLLAQTDFQTEYGIIEVPWSYLCTAQMIEVASNHFGVTLNPEKLDKAGDKGSYLSALIRKSRDFTASYGKGCNFPNVQFSFSAEEILSCIGHGKGDDRTCHLGHIQKWIATSEDKENQAIISLNQKTCQTIVCEHPTEEAVQESASGLTQTENPPNTKRTGKNESDTERALKESCPNTTREKGQKFSIEMNDDFSFVITPYHPTSDMQQELGVVNSSLDCTNCKKSCRNETLTCSICSLMVHHKCYPCQAYYGNTRALKRKVMASSTFNTLKKITNFFWRCKNCESVDVMEAILSEASQAVKENSQKKTNRSNNMDQYSIMSDAISEITNFSDTIPDTQTDEVPVNGATGKIDYSDELGIPDTQLKEDAQERSRSSDESELVRQDAQLNLTQALQEQRDHILDMTRSIDDMKKSLTQLRNSEDEHFTTLLKKMENSPVSVHTTGTLYKDIAAKNTYPGQTILEYRQLEPSLKKENSIIISGDLCRKSVCNSKAIMHNFNTYYQNRLKIKSSFVTKAGSLLIEFNNPEEAQEVTKNWNPSYYTDKRSEGETRCNLLSMINKNSVIIKQVPKSINDTELNISVAKSFSGATAKRFVTKEKVKLGTVKIDFEEETEREKALTLGIKLGEEIFPAEKYEPRRRIIQCYNCLKYGHVAKLCRQDHPTCSTCGRDHHVTSCKYRRAHCSNCDQDGHSATDKQCPKFRDIAMKMNLLPNRNQFSQKYYDF